MSTVKIGTVITFRQVRCVVIAIEKTERTFMAELPLDDYLTSHIGTPDLRNVLKKDFDQFEPPDIVNESYEKLTLRRLDDNAGYVRIYPTYTLRKEKEDGPDNQEEDRATGGNNPHDSTGGEGVGGRSERGAETGKLVEAQEPRQGGTD